MVKLFASKHYKIPLTPVERTSCTPKGNTSEKQVRLQRTLRKRVTIGNANFSQQTKNTNNPAPNTERAQVWW